MTTQRALSQPIIIETICSYATMQTLARLMSVNHCMFDAAVKWLYMDLHPCIQKAATDYEGFVQRMEQSVSRIPFRGSERTTIVEV